MKGSRSRIQLHLYEYPSLFYSKNLNAIYISLDRYMSYSIQQNDLPMSYLLRRLDFAKFNIWEDLIWLWLKTIDVVISSSTMKVEDSKKNISKSKDK